MCPRLIRATRYTFAQDAKGSANAVNDVYARTQKRMTRNCRLPVPCVYFIQGSCEYMAIEKRKRPCKPGDECTVKKEMDGPRKKVWPLSATEDTIKKLYDSGHSDPVIAQACDVSRGMVLRWRQKNNLPPNRRGGRPSQNK